MARPTDEELRRKEELFSRGLHRCFKCREDLPLKNFSVNRANRLGLHSICRSCQSAYGRARYSAARNRTTRLRLFYKMTDAEYAAMHSSQDGRCAVCLDPLVLAHVDHDHSCCPGKRSCGGCVRSLLCGSCNQGLGNFKDSPARLRSAADYLARWNP